MSCCNPWVKQNNNDFPITERIDRLERDVSSLVDRVFGQNAVIEYRNGLAYINGNPYISLKTLANKRKEDLREMINRYLLAAPLEKEG